MFPAALSGWAPGTWSHVAKIKPLPFHATEKTLLVALTKWDSLIPLNTYCVPTTTCLTGCGEVAKDTGEVVPGPKERSV